MNDVAKEKEMPGELLRLASLRNRRAGGLNVLCSILLMLALISLSADSEVWASESGVFSDRIVFGQSAPLSGRTQKIAQSMMAGIRAAFDEINSQGGIGGRQLILVSEDDSYDPVKARQITQSFIDSNEIFAIIGSIGTPTAKVTAALADQYQPAFHCTFFRR